MYILLFTSLVYFSPTRGAQQEITSKNSVDGAKNYPSNFRSDVTFLLQIIIIIPMSWVCVVCVLSSHSFWTSSSLDVPAGVTQEEGHTGFFTHLLSAVRALIFLARRIQPFLSLVDYCEVESCVLTIQSFSTRWAFYFSFLVF